LIDRDSIVRYSSADGENLEEIRAAMEKYAGNPKIVK
jgi:hypothetical protein